MCCLRLWTGGFLQSAERFRVFLLESFQFLLHLFGHLPQGGFRVVAQRGSQHGAGDNGQLCHPVILPVVSQGIAQHTQESCRLFPVLSLCRSLGGGEEQERLLAGSVNEQGGVHLAVVTAVGTRKIVQGSSTEAVE